MKILTKKKNYIEIGCMPETKTINFLTKIDLKTLFMKFKHFL